MFAVLCCSRTLASSPGRGQATWLTRPMLSFWKSVGCRKGDSPVVLVPSVHLETLLSFKLWESLEMPNTHSQERLLWGPLGGSAGGASDSWFPLRSSLSREIELYIRLHA